jgi:plasmid stability protein
MAEIIIRNMPREMRQELKIQAAREGRSMQAIIIGLIADYIEMRRKETELYNAVMETMKGGG